MLEELDVVALTHNIDKYKLREGAKGTIVQLYKSGTAFAVEFVDAKGYTIALIDLTPKDVRLISSKNLPKNITYRDRSTAKNEDKEWNWASLKYLKPDKARDFTKNFHFFI